MVEHNNAAGVSRYARLVGWNLLLAAAGTALPFVERLAQEVDRSIIERRSSVFVVWVCGNKNHARGSDKRSSQSITDFCF
jgi:hypothetical protein